MVTNATSYDVLIGGGVCSGYGAPFMILFFMCLLTGFSIPIKVFFNFQISSNRIFKTTNMYI